MIFKAYEAKKINIDKNNIILFYGENQGAKEDEISKLLLKNKDKSLSKYNEKQILDDPEIFYNEVLSKSLFENKKIILINYATDKLNKIIEEIFEKEINDISIIINSSLLEKKSKLRTLFEKNKELICVPFYPDTPEILSKLTYDFIREKNISISRENINLIINKCNGDRGILKNELDKIYFFAQNKKKISTENILKLINLIENYSISELVDNCLAKNHKKTLHILNENNFNSEDCIIITRTFLSKLKKILKLSKDYQKNKDLNKTISNAKPPIFWKDKEIIKQQINKLDPAEITKLIIKINEIELQIKKNNTNPVNIVSDFILNQSLITN
jgi:DNA polymerase-3 subunit delta